MQSQYTPGPWKAILNNPTAITEGHTIKADNEVETPIAHLWVGGGTHGKPRQLANAHLIAAAPELLGALQNLSKNCFTEDETRLSLFATARGGEISNELEERCDRIEAAFVAARALLARLALSLT